jgi:DNA-binding SARP family transcriptional activator
MQRVVGKNEKIYFDERKGVFREKTKTQQVLLVLASGCFNRREIAARVWPERTEDEAWACLRATLGNIKQRGYLRQGRGIRFTPKSLATLEKMRNDQK